MSKPFTNLETQVEILKSRGIIFDDEEDSIANFQKSTIYRAFAAFPCKIIAPICANLNCFVPYFVP